MQLILRLQWLPELFIYDLKIPLMAAFGEKIVWTTVSHFVIQTKKRMYISSTPKFSSYGYNFSVMPITLLMITLQKRNTHSGIFYTN